MIKSADFEYSDRENGKVFPELAFSSQNFKIYGFFAKNLSFGLVIA